LTSPRGPQKGVSNSPYSHPFCRSIFFFPPSPPFSRKSSSPPQGISDRAWVNNPVGPKACKIKPSTATRYPPPLSPPPFGFLFRLILFNLSPMLGDVSYNIDSPLKDSPDPFWRSYFSPHPWCFGCLSIPPAFFFFFYVPVWDIVNEGAVHRTPTASANSHPLSSCFPPEPVPLFNLCGSSISC